MLFFIDACFAVCQNKNIASKGPSIASEQQCGENIFFRFLGDIVLHHQPRCRHEHRPESHKKKPAAYSDSWP
jgi:hypothetical protein